MEVSDEIDTVCLKLYNVKEKTSQIIQKIKRNSEETNYPINRHTTN